MTTRQMTEEQMVGLLRNALVVAGQEMGDDGDHWPVINSTIHSIMKDWEDLKVERNVFAEVQKHYLQMIAELKTLAAASSGTNKTQLETAISEISEIYASTFTPVSPDDFYVSEEDVPLHVQRAGAIVNTLEEEGA